MVEDMSEQQKKEIVKWFLLNSPPGEIQYIAKDLRSILNDDTLYNESALEAFPLYNKFHMISLQLPDKCGDVLLTQYNELAENEFLDPRTGKVAIVNHVKQVCTKVRPATDKELPSVYIEEFRCALDLEIDKYVSETYPRGVSSVFCSSGKDLQGPGSNFELTVIISASRNSPQNFCYGCWRSTWRVQFNGDVQRLEVAGRLQVTAHYFEEGNVQLDAKHESNDATDFQAPGDCALSLINIISHQESKYLGFIEASYSNLPNSTFKGLRRKLPVTRTLFPWHNATQFSLAKEIQKEIGRGREN